MVNNPEQALDPDISAHICVYGMKVGSFTGKKLDDYINSKIEDFVGARKIVNGTDKDTLIADYAKYFLGILLEFL